MKNFFTVLFIIFCHALQAQTGVRLPIDSSTKKITYAEVVSVDSASAKTLYSRAKYFMANAFKNSQHVNQLQDENNFTIVGKGTMQAYLTRSNKPYEVGFISFTLTIICKDERYKYIVTDLEHTNPTVSSYGNMSGGALENEKPNCGSFYMPKKYWEELKDYADKDIRNFIADLKKQMSSNQNENW